MCDVNVYFFSPLPAGLSAKYAAHAEATSMQYNVRRTYKLCDGNGMAPRSSHREPRGIRTRRLCLLALIACFLITIQNNAFEEQMAVEAEFGDSFNGDAIAKMVYLDACVKETTRQVCTFRIAVAMNFSKSNRWHRWLFSAMQ